MEHLNFYQAYGDDAHPDPESCVVCQGRLETPDSRFEGLVFESHPVRPAEYTVIAGGNRHEQNEDNEGAAQEGEENEKGNQEDETEEHGEEEGEDDEGEDDEQTPQEHEEDAEEAQNT